MNDCKQPNSSLNYGLIKNKLIGVAKNIIGETAPDKQTEIDFDTQQFIYHTLKVSFNTFSAASFLCSDAEDCPGRKLSFSADLPILTRSILDNLILIIYICEDPKKRISEFLKSGYREIIEDQQRFQSRQFEGDAFDKWMMRSNDFIQIYKKNFIVKISSEEERNPSLIRYFPHPGQILSKKKLTNLKNQDFASFLNDWFYVSLSQATHLNSWSGLAMRMKAIHFDEKSNDDRDILEKTKSDHFIVLVTIFLLLLHEINTTLKFSYKPQLEYIWTVINSYFDFSQDVYNKRYSS